MPERIFSPELVQSSLWTSPPPFAPRRPRLPDGPPPRRWVEWPGPFPPPWGEREE